MEPNEENKNVNDRSLGPYAIGHLIDAPIEEVLMSMKSFGIEYENRSLPEVLQIMKVRYEYLRKNLQPTYAPQTCYYLGRKFNFFKERLLCLERWNYGKSIVCPILLKDVLKLKGKSKEYLIDFNLLMRNWGIISNGNDLDIAIKEANVLLKILLIANYILIERKCLLPENYFDTHPILKKRVDFPDIKWNCYDFQITFLRCILEDLEYIKSLKPHKINYLFDAILCN